ncbi:MAG: hypothetical protein F6J93_15995 [Oscillatoria sp. SIO1A7]|nr:hypothetical protein [Oscillatoria sp. SIO1A7]
MTFPSDLLASSRFYNDLPSLRMRSLPWPRLEKPKHIVQGGRSNKRSPSYGREPDSFGVFNFKF